MPEISRFFGIVIYHFDRKRLTRATFGGQNATPLWSRDNAVIYYASIHAAEQATTIWRRNADGSGEPEALGTLPHRIYLNDLSRDGLSALFDYSSPNSQGSDVGSVALSKDAVPTPLLQSAFEEYGARLSPDGRWLAYTSTESSRPEVYVRPAAAGASGRWQVSTAGGEEPRWSKDGRTLYYHAQPLLLAVPIEPGPGFEYGAPATVLTNLYNPRLETAVSYDVHADGRFLMIRLPDAGGVATTIRLIVGWADGLRKIVS